MGLRGGPGAAEERPAIVAATDAASGSPGGVSIGAGAGESAKPESWDSMRRLLGPMLGDTAGMEEWRVWVVVAGCAALTGPDGDRGKAALCWLTAATAEVCHAVAVAWSVNASRRTRRFSLAISGGQMMRKQNCRVRAGVRAGEP